MKDSEKELPKAELKDRYRKFLPSILAAYQAELKGDKTALKKAVMENERKALGMQSESSKQDS